MNDITVLGPKFVLVVVFVCIIVAFAANAFQTGKAEFEQDASVKISEMLSFDGQQNGTTFDW